MIKNQTVYLGKLKLKFEKNPYYRNPKSMLNKVHLDLGFVKLVSRLYFRKSPTGINMADPEKKWLISKNTGGKIGPYFPDQNEPLYNSFVYIDYSGSVPKTVLIGDIELGWMFYENKMRVCPTYPKNVAIKIDSDWNVLEFYGYSHRGGQTFKIGDRIFDSNFVPIPEHYEEWEWIGYTDKFQEVLDKADKFEKERLLEDGIVSIIPFTRRGSITIETNEQAELAAYSFSRYVN